MTNHFAIMREEIRNFPMEWWIMFAQALLSDTSPLSSIVYTVYSNMGHLSGFTIMENTL